MKITYFIGSLIGGGAEHVISDLASEMSRRGHDSEILIATNTDNKYPLDPKVGIVCLESKVRFKNKPLRLLQKMINLGRYIIKSRTDVYIVFLPETIRAIMFFRKLIKKPIIVSERTDPESYSDVVQQQMVKCFSKADGMVLQTNHALSYYTERIQKSIPTEIIPNAIRMTGIEKYKGTRKKKIVSVGRFTPAKNFTLLIKAFSLFQSEYQEYSLEIYGDGELINEYKKTVVELGIEDKVCFPGYVENVTDRIKDASLYVMSSDWEGMPNALIEAMAVGLPCISTRCKGGAPEALIEDNKNGILVPVGDAEKMASAMKRIVSDENLQNRLSDNAIIIAEKLSSNKVYSKWESFIKMTVRIK